MNRAPHFWFSTKFNRADAGKDARGMFSAGVARKQMPLRPHWIQPLEVYNNSNCFKIYTITDCRVYPISSPI